jgi:hypothetical protein
MKIGNDIGWLASGPRAGIAELRLPADEPDASMMSGGDIHDPFVSYAGPWAETPAGWAEMSISDDTLDSDGRCFADHVSRAFASNTSDWLKYEMAVGGEVGAASDEVGSRSGSQYESAPVTLVVR